MRPWTCSKCKCYTEEQFCPNCGLEPAWILDGEGYADSESADRLAGLCVCAGVLMVGLSLLYVLWHALTGE